MKQAAAEGVVEIYKHVATMRMQRMHMVQTQVCIHVNMSHVSHQFNIKIWGRLPILTPLSGYPNKTNSFKGKIISKLGLGVYCIRL